VIMLSLTVAETRIHMFLQSGRTIVQFPISGLEAMQILVMLTRAIDGLRDSLQLPETEPQFSLQTPARSNVGIASDGSVLFLLKAFEVPMFSFKMSDDEALASHPTSRRHSKRICLAATSAAISEDDWSFGGDEGPMERCRRRSLVGATA
jgi:hypothetical protein